MNNTSSQKQKFLNLWKRIKRYRWMYLLALPGLTFFIVMKYLPMWGLLLAFKDYNPYIGFFASDWIGLEHFRNFFSK